MLGQVSTWMGDRLGTPGAVVAFLLLAGCLAFLSLLKFLKNQIAQITEMEAKNAVFPSNGHTTWNIPVLVRSLKSSHVGPG